MAGRGGGGGAFSLPQGPDKPLGLNIKEMT